MLDVFNRASQRLLAAGAGVEQGRILHSQGLKTGGKFFGFVTGDDLVVKVPAARVQELIEGGAGAPFDAGKGRPMKEWVRLHPDDAATCWAYLDEARAFVSALGQRVSGT